MDTSINNAGIYIAKPFTDYTDEDFAARVRGEPHAASSGSPRSAIAAMLAAQAAATLVNISTTWPNTRIQGPVSARPHSPRAGWRGHPLTGDRVRGRGIRVNTFSLGVIQTPVLLGGDPRAAARLGPPRPWGRSPMSSTRLLFLEAAPFITGEILHIDGGRLAGL